jgi:hypothetical protein
MFSIKAVVLTSYLFAGWFSLGKCLSLVFQRSPNFSRSLSSYFALGFCIWSALVGLLLAFSVAFPPLDLLILIPCLVVAGSLTLLKVIRRQLIWRLPAMAVYFSSGLLVMVGAIGRGIGQARNYADDAPSYIYFARKIEVTGGLIDAFNSRRIDTFGLFSAINSIYYKVLGVQGVYLSDYLLGGLIVLIAFVELSQRTKMGGPFGCIIGVLAIAGTGIEFISNLSPTFLICGLVLLSFHFINRLLADRQEITVRDLTWNALLLGLLLGSIEAMRPQSVISVIVTLIVGLSVLVARKPAKTLILLVSCALVAIVGGVLTVLCGWMIALWESSRTPLFPFIKGNGDPLYGLKRHSFDLAPILVAIRHSLLAVFAQGKSDAAEYVGCVLLIALVALALGIFRSNLDISCLIVLAGSLLGLAIQWILVTNFILGTDVFGNLRYQVATLMATAYFAIASLWTVIATPRAILQNPRYLHASERSSSRSMNVLLGIVGVLATTFALFGISSPWTPGRQVALAVSSVRQAFVPGLLGFNQEISGTNPTLVDPKSVEEMNRLIPRGSKVLSAIETPSILDMSKFDVATVDWPGGASPSPGIPINGNSEELASYLRSCGFNYLLVQSPLTQDTLYSYSNISAGRFKASNPWTSFQSAHISEILSSWVSLERGLMNSPSYGVSVIGDLALIDLRKSSNQNSSYPGFNQRKVLLEKFFGNEPNP